MGEPVVDMTSPGAVAAGIDELLADALAGSVPVGAAIDPQVLDDVRSELDAAATRAADLVRGALEGDELAAVLPLRLPKSRVVALGGCERYALASAADAAHQGDDLPVAVLLGRAIDVFVEHEIHAGAVGDPLEDLLSWIDARGELDVRDQVISVAGEMDLAPLAAAARALAGLDESWWPRTQVAAAVHLADGDVRCEGRTDVELGGPLSGRPGVVVEVKVGRPRPGHLAEVTHYAVLVALRDGAAPALVARWYPGGSVAAQPVTEAVVRSASRRLADAISAWGELSAGRPPSEVPGPVCAWCPDAGVCPSFEPAPDPFDGGRP